MDMERERMPVEGEEIGPKEGEGIDEVLGIPNDELEAAHQKDAAKEAEEELKEESEE